jgi:hypothetical protein
MRSSPSCTTAHPRRRREPHYYYYDDDDDDYLITGCDGRAMEGERRTVLKASKISSQRAGLPPCSSMFSRMN